MKRITVHQRGDVRLEQELVKDERERKQAACTRQQSGFTDREVALACCSTRLDEAPCSVVHPHSHELCTQTVLRPEDVHSSHYILPADGALAHPLPTFGAGYHVTTLQQHAVDDGVHADSTQVFIGGQLSPDTICWREEQISFSSLVQASSKNVSLKWACYPGTHHQRATDMLLPESRDMQTFST